MSNDEFETWLSLVGRLLGLSERQQQQIGEELRDHLESRVADLLESGMDKQSAVMQAVEEFGDAAVLAKNLQSVSLANRKRWMMRFMTLATAGLFLVAVLTMAMWPQEARFGSPSQSVAQDQDPFGSGDDGTNANPFAKGGGPAVAATAKAVDKIQPSARSMSNMKIREKLKQSFDLVYDAELFGDVKAHLSEQLKLNIVVHQNLAGVLDDDTEFSANLADVRLSDGLRMMLNPVDATYAIKNGVLLIICIDDESEPDFLSRHMIDVGEVLALINTMERNRIGKPIARAVRGGGGGFGGGGNKGGGGGFCISPQEVAGSQKGGDSEQPVQVMPQQHQEIMTAERLLIETVTRVVNPDQWVASGSGNNSDLTCIGGVLVVLSNESLAEEVQDFVTDLEYQLKKRLEK